MNDAGTELYVMNLGDQSLYVVPINPDGSAGTPRAFAVPTPVGRNGQPIARGDVRPFAVEYRNGLVYVGLVNSAESTQNRGEPRGRPAGLRVLVRPGHRQYSAGSVVDDGSGSTGSPWTTPGGSVRRVGRLRPVVPGVRQRERRVPAGRARRINAVKYPQPMLTGLAFDAAGNLTLGFRTRDGDQTGFLSLLRPEPPGRSPSRGSAAATC